MKNLNMKVPDVLHYRFKVACTLAGEEMSAVIRNFIEDYVEKMEKRKLIVIQKNKR